ncbi:MAG TPA: SRPBCC family protein [Candidatus Thermoplasmatota archaeon]|nr:SRPBCC family protein [Candidatus Thermoplasmatota archaeon]
MPSFTRSIAIRRSPEQVFAVLDQLEQAPQWMPSIKRIDVLTPGMPMGVGFRWRETRRVLGILRMKVVLVVSAHDPPRSWGLTYNDGKVQATAAFELSTVPSGTHVAFTEDVEDLQGKVKRAERMMRMMERQDDDLLDRLKAHVEATTEEPPGLAPDLPLAAPAVEETGREWTTAAKPAKAAKVTKAKPTPRASTAGKGGKAGKAGRPAQTTAGKHAVGRATGKKAKGAAAKKR